jgi:hypothetical protein
MLACLTIRATITVLPTPHCAMFANETHSLADTAASVALQPQWPCHHQALPLQQQLCRWLPQQQLGQTGARASSRGWRMRPLVMLLLSPGQSGRREVSLPGRYVCCCGRMLHVKHPESHVAQPFI